MKNNNRAVRCKQQCIRAETINSDAYRFFNLLTGPDLFSTVEALLPEEHRERLFPPTETLSMFLAQAMSEDRSCQKAVNDATVKRVVGGLSPCSTATGGYCQARQRLPLTMVSTLACYIGRQISDQSAEHWRWNGKRVYLIDGTTVTLADTAANQGVYPQQRGQKPGVGFPISRIVGVIGLSSGALVNAAMGPYHGKGGSEQSLLRPLLDTFENGDLVVGDAYYGTYFLLASLLEKGVDGVFEQMGTRRRVTDFRKGQRLGSKDHLITLPKPGKPHWMTQQAYDRAPASIVIREVKVKGKVLITTLLSPKVYPKHELRGLYRDRWHIELDLRHIKTTLGMETLSCKTPDMVEKEMWVYFLAYNLIRLLMAQSALLAGIAPRQLSFKHTVQLWIAWSQQTQATSVCVDDHLLFILIAQNTVGNRPGRIEPRAIKRRPKAYSLLMEARTSVRTRIEKHGHPRKCKA